MKGAAKYLGIVSGDNLIVKNKKRNLINTEVKDLLKAYRSKFKNF